MSGHPWARTAGVAVALLAAAGESDAAPVFLLDASEATIFDVLPPWTQNEACDCCVCWETTLGTIFAYWDDVYYPSEGPWESLLLYGNRDTPAAFQATTQALWEISGLGCNEGAQSIPFWSYQARDVARQYTEGLGYSFDYDVDEWVWFGEDVADEIDADRPIYYAYEPEGDSAHAVTLVGYDATDETLYLYKNWEPVLTLKGFDEATNHRTINITPGGSATVPGAWTCSASFYEAGDGCNCGCGIYDTDCDNEIVALGCEEGESCSPDGDCVGCEDECALPAGERCDGEGAVVSCEDTDADGCLELGTPTACSDGSVCQDGACMPCTCEVPDERQCTDDSHVRVCTALTASCSRWTDPIACPEGESCIDDRCSSGVPSGGSGGSGTPLVPTAKVEPHEEAGCCTVAPGRADRSPGRALVGLAALVALGMRRRRAVREAEAPRS